MGMIQNLFPEETDRLDVTISSGFDENLRETMPVAIIVIGTPVVNGKPAMDKTVTELVSLLEPETALHLVSDAASQGIEEMAGETEKSPTQTARDQQNELQVTNSIAMNAVAILMERLNIERVHVAREEAMRHTGQVVMLLDGEGYVITLEE
jgi:hypothetical protein